MYISKPRVRFILKDLLSIQNMAFKCQPKILWWFDQEWDHTFETLSSMVGESRAIARSVVGI